LSCCYVESHKENSQPDVQRVSDDTAKQPSLHQGHHRTLTSPVTISESHADKDDEISAPPVKRPSIFGSVALLAESSSTSSTPSRSARHRLTPSSSPFPVASNVDAAPFVTPPYTPRSRSQTGQSVTAAATPTLQQPLPSRRDDISASLMTPPSVMTPDSRQQHQRGLPMTCTPPFTPVRPATTTPVGRPRSRLSLNCPSQLQDLTRPPLGSLALVSRIYFIQGGSKK